MPFSHLLRSPWLRRLAWTLAGLLLLLWALAWLAVPPLLKSQLEQRGSAALGRKLTVGAIDFKPWSLQLTLTDLALAKADGSAPQLDIARVYVDADIASLLRLAPVLDAVTVEAPRLQLTHLGGGHYDIDDILERLAAPSDTPPAAPLKFALYNLVLNGGALDFTDRVGQTERQHTLRELHLALPFLSNLDSQRDIMVEPRLRFVLNGSAFDSAAQGTPFAQTRKGEVTLNIAHLDLAPYLPYQPASLPVRLKSAALQAQLQMRFEQAQQAHVGLRGTLQITGLQMVDAAGAALLGVQTLKTELADVRPLEGVVKLASLEITGPKLSASRNRAGRINLDLAAPAKSPSATKNIAQPSDSTRATAKNDLENLKKEGAAPTPPSTPSPWHIELAQFALHQGEVNWADDHLQPRARLDLTQVELQAQALRWPMDAAPATFGGSARVPARGQPAQLAFQGEGTDQQGQVHVTLDTVALGLAAPYLAQYLEPAVQGRLDAELDVQWQAGQWQLAVSRLAVQDFALQADRAKAAAAKSAPPLRGAERAAAEMPRFQRLEVSDAQIDLAARSARVGKIALRAPSAMVHRDAQGRWMLEQWLKTPATPSAAPAHAPARSAANAASTAPPWKLAVAALTIDDGTLMLDDRSQTRPVRLEALGLKVHMRDLTLDGKKPAPLTVSAKVRAGRTEPGSLHYQGSVMWDPVVAQGRLEARDLPMHALAPYFAQRLNVDLLRADLGFQGQVRYAALPGGPDLKLQGDAALEDFLANSIVSAGQGQGEIAEELLSWKSLNVPGIQLAMAPGAALRLQVREAALSDFFARVIVHENGRVNLQDLVRTQATGADGSAAPVPNLASSAPVAAAPVPAPAPVATAPAANIQFGPISLVHGKVLFSDRFIKPNYSADLSELTGKLSQFSNQPVDGVVPLADLDLRGRAEGTASLEITGKVNPLVQPLALDIRGRVRDLELPPLSPYAIKYAGYGIERGKLSMDVHYAVQPDGQLSASNNFVLNQLRFGNAVEGAPNSLPVKLAVALLADRNGVIDLDLPISGSLNDPQFSLGAVVWKVITNLVVKAISAPFSLLANALGGDGGAEEAAVVRFAPGSSALLPQAQQGLDKIAQALLDRPALNLTVVGTASLEAEREALKGERLAGLLMAEKRRRAVVRGQEGDSVAPVSAAEAPALLKEVYRRADITKPRNLLGLTKDIEPADMQALLKANMAVTEDAMRDLALQRSVAVKDYLATRQLDGQRLFLGAPKLVAPQEAWTPRAELNLDHQ